MLNCMSHSMYPVCVPYRTSPVYNTVCLFCSAKFELVCKATLKLFLGLNCVLNKICDLKVVRAHVYLCVLPCICPLVCISVCVWVCMTIWGRRQQSGQSDWLLTDIKLNQSKKCWGFQSDLIVLVVLQQYPGYTDTSRIYYPVCRHQVMVYKMPNHNLRCREWRPSCCL